MPRQKNRPLAFISYRRVDSSAASRWLADTISRTFGSQCVFIDTESIRVTEDWADRINEALRETTLFIPVIGPNWLSIADKHGRRRIDKPSDWVNREIRYALKNQKQILPIVISDIAMPEQEALPENISGLTRFQCFELRDQRWKADLDLLIRKLEELGFRRPSPEVIEYPAPHVTLRELTESELLKALPKPWVVTESDLPGQPGQHRVELYRTYRFASFEEAIHFMSAAVPVINKIQHHPRWQNTWKTVAVWSTTWDIGHRPSKLDLKLATLLDNLYRKIGSADKKGRL